MMAGAGLAVMASPFFFRYFYYTTDMNYEDYFKGKKVTVSGLKSHGMAFQKN